MKKWMFKSGAFVSMVLAAALTVTACGSASSTGGSGETAAPAEGSGAAPAETAAEAPKETFKIRWTTVSVPNDAHTKAMDVFKEEIEKSTNGQILVENYHSGSLFNSDSDMQAVMRGNAEMSYTSAATLAEHLPKLSMFTAGYTFKDYDHMTKVLNGDIGKKLFDEVAQTIGIRPLGAFYLGSRQLNYKDIGRVIQTPADMEGVKLRMPNAPAWLFLGEALGANATPLAFSELYLALSSGTVDMQDNPLPTVQNAKFYEVTSNITLTGHVVDAVLPTINEEMWQKMGPELQQKVLDAIEKARQFCDETNLKAEAELVDFFKTQGMEVNTPDVEAFRTKVQAAYAENAEITKDWDMKLYEEVQALVE